MAAFLFLLLCLVIAFIYSIPPFRFVNRGFGEFLLAAQLAYIFPSIAYILQAGETHNFLMLTIPLTFLAFGYFIVMDFPSFASDQKYNRFTFLTAPWLGTCGAIASSFCFACISALYSFSRIWYFTFTYLARLPHAALCSLSNLSTPKHCPWRTHELNYPDYHCPGGPWPNNILFDSHLLASLISHLSTCLLNPCPNS